MFYVDDIDEAKNIKEKRRKVLPGIYNPSKLFEKPLPLLVLVTDNEKQQSDEESNEKDPLSESNDGEPQNCDDESNDVASTVSNDSNGAVATNMSSSNNHSETPIQSSPNSERNDSQAKSVDESSINLQSNDDQVGIVDRPTKNQAVTTDILSSALDTALAITTPIKKEPVFTQLGIENQKAVEDVFNSSYEACDEEGEILVYTKDVIPMPIGQRNPYEVKKNDILSGNMAYAINVREFYFWFCFTLYF